jgi:hypothetical protein
MWETKPAVGYGMAARLVLARPTSALQRPVTGRHLGSQRMIASTSLASSRVQVIASSRPTRDHLPILVDDDLVRQLPFEHWGSLVASYALDPPFAPSFPARSDSWLG